MSRGFGPGAKDVGGTGEPASSRGAVVGTTVGLIPLFGLVHSLSASDRPLLTVLAAACALGLFAASQVILAWAYHSARLGRRFRLALLVPLTALSVALPLWLGKDWTILLPYLSATGAVAVPARLTLPALAASAALAVFVAGRTGADPTSLVVMTTAVGLAMTTYRRILDLNAELRRTRRALARAAVTEERLRFSRDMHDTLGHSLLQLTLRAEVTRRLHRVGETDVEAELQQIEDMGRQCLEQVREAVTGYRRLSLSAVIDQARTTLADAGVTVTVDATAGRLPEAVKTALSWVAREALTNVARHSRAAHCRVVLRSEDGRALLRVLDDGIGPARSLRRSRPGPDGNGLAGLAERVAALDGRLHTGAAPGGGFRLQAAIPLAAAGHTPETT
ncbi:two-component system, NarL family, sensor histidine kinase DesK [Streptomyces sp. 2112.3]|uniref:sensor histidine kinase n=1 Tax=Streptomyces sp. 2112.3 TaxID=1881023 RepID=UPI00089669F0|nr:sensor histidine kinase [Streptomyces sp. 2112.3]SEF13463.1 two-component system, NarL family, sensor histidine kinase DesK [Streptomyces sp. 2112.3]